MSIVGIIGIVGIVMFVFGVGYGITNLVMDIDSMTNTKIKVYSHYGIISAICMVVGFIITCVCIK